MTPGTRRCVCLAVAAVVFAGAAEAASPLRVCIEEQSAPFSWATGIESAEGMLPPESAARGIDYDVASSVAALLVRPLHVRFFDASREDDLSFVSQAHALLSQADCDLIVGYPLTRDSLGPPPRSSPLAASRPYLSLPLTIVSTQGGPAVSRLEDVVGLRIAVERDSLASAIATVYAGGALRERLLRVSFEDDAIFRALETGAADAAFVELHRFELYRARRPVTALRETGYRHALAVHTGFVGISPPLVGQVDDALRVLVETGRIAEIVEAQGLSYSPPGRPEILPRLSPRLLAQPDAER